jgi:hypothetical protein
MPSGWFPDPHGRHDHRWFNGTAWTADVSDDGQRFIDPLGAGPAGPAGPGTSPATGRQGNGSAVAAITLGLFALMLAWIPLLVVIGVLLAVLALVFGIKGLRRSRTAGSGRGLAIAGIATGGKALALAVVGVILTVAMLREVGSFIEPAEHEAEVTSCSIGDGRIVVDATLTNLGSAVSDFTVYAVFVEPDGVADARTEVDAVAPGETREIRLDRNVAAVGECQARLVVHGPLPYGLDMERVND